MLSLPPFQGIIRSLDPRLLLQLCRSTPKSTHDHALHICSPPESTALLRLASHLDKNIGDKYRDCNMGMMARDIVLCALVLLQLLCAAHSHGSRRILELPQNLSPAPAPANKSNVLRGSLIHRDYLESTTAKTNTATIPTRERFFESMERSRRRAAQLTSYSSPLSAPPNFGDYYMQIAFGTPAQKFTVVADTGSDLCWVHCTASCTGRSRRCKSSYCSNGGSCNVFNPSASSSYKPSSCSDPMCTALRYVESCSTDRSTCQFNGYTYGDGSSTSGDLGYDVVTLSGSTGPAMAFGCGTTVSGALNNFDGLMGLGNAPLSLPNQLAKSGVENIFSYCLVDQAAVNKGTGSLITFGAAAENSGASYTPMLTVQGAPFYYVQVTGITVGGAALPIDASVLQINRATGNGGVILDSGTTLSMWPQSVFTAISNAYRKNVKYPVSVASSAELCFNTKGVNPSAVTFPDFGMQMTNVSISTPGSTVFELMSDGVTYCLMMTTSGNAPISIIGNVQQRDFLVVYDLVKKQIGFLRKICSTMT